MKSSRWGVGQGSLRWLSARTLEQLERRDLMSASEPATLFASSPVAISDAMPVLSRTAIAPSLGVELPNDFVRTPQAVQASINVPAGNYMLLTASGNIVIPTDALQDPDIAGFVLRDNWSYVNPAPGVYNWSRLDAAISKVVAAGKQFKLTIFTGVMAPDWLYQTGMQSMNFVEEAGGMRPPGTYRMPVPWDPVMLGYYDNLLSEMSAHFGSNANLVGVNLGGPTQYSVEMHLPPEVATQPGYSPAAIRGAWDHVLTTYAGLFPNTAGIVALANPVYVTDGVAAQVAADTVSILGNRATLQHDALSAKSTLAFYNIHQLLVAYAQLGVRIGFEELTVSSNSRFGGTFDTAWQTVLSAGGKYLDLYQPDDKLAQPFPPSAAVVGRQAFYNNSAFDGYSPFATAADDGAIAPDKAALLPGGTASFSNYTSYSRGINGLMVDIAGLNGTPTAADFRFLLGNNSTPDEWLTAPAPLSISVRVGAGTGGSDRVTLIWADGAIINQWLKVTILATPTTNLAAADVFYFGNAIGETGDSATNAWVNSTDEIAIRNNPKTFLDPATIDSLFDLNRDTFVNATDLILARGSSTPLWQALQLISPPQSAVPLSLAVSATANPAAALPVQASLQVETRMPADSQQQPSPRLSATLPPQQLQIAQRLAGRLPSKAIIRAAESVDRLFVHIWS